MSSYELPIGLRLGSYELLARIGEGGMGAVYAAVHVGLGKRVAIKTLRAELADDPDVRARFVREGKAAVAVRHPNVVDIDDVGVYENVPYLVMELLDGENLHALIMRRERLTVQETADIVVPVLSAMAESHRAGVVHRDLKPDNIFLARGAGGLPVPKVLDFGISKLRETQSAGLTGDNALLGTPYYMAPEQASSARDVDARSDLYAIGVILYHAVSGRVPFMGGSLAQVIGQILHAQAIPLSENVPGIPAAFEAIVVRLMEKDPARRYQDALSLGQALLAFASDRIALTYRNEFFAVPQGGIETPVLHPPAIAGVDTTLRSAARSVATTVPVQYGSAFGRWAGWTAVGAVALVGAAVVYWPRSTEQTDTSLHPSLEESGKAPPSAAAPGASVPPPEAAEPKPVVEPEAPPAKDHAEVAPNEAKVPPEALQPKAATPPASEPSADSEPTNEPGSRNKAGGRAATTKPARVKSKPKQQAPKAAPEADVWGDRK